MWFDTLVFRLEVTSQEVNQIRALATSGFTRFDYDLDNSKETSIVKLGSYYAGLRISTVTTNEHQFGVQERQFIRVEYSAHKWAKGVNGRAGLALTDSCNYAPLRLALKHCGIAWNPSQIEVRRVDIGSLWRIHPLGYRRFWSAVGRMYYARRTASIHPTTIYWGTKDTRTYEKFYGKEEEQRKHKKDLPEWLDQKEYFQELTGMVRFEVEYRTKYLKDAFLNDYFGETEKLTLDRFKKILKTGQLQNDFNNREANKMQQLPKEQEGVKTYDQIKEALSKYSGLYKYWHEVRDLGPKVVLEDYKARKKESVFYRYRTRLQKMGIPQICLMDENLEARLLTMKALRNGPTEAEIEATKDLYKMERVGEGPSADELRLIYIM